MCWTDSIIFMQLTHSFLLQIWLFACCNPFFTPYWTKCNTLNTEKIHFFMHLNYKYYEQDITKEYHYKIKNKNRMCNMFKNISKLYNKILINIYFKTLFIDNFFILIFIVISLMVWHDSTFSWKLACFSKLMAYKQW